MVPGRLVPTDDCHSFTLPSSFVMAPKLTFDCVLESRGDRIVNVALRPDAGVPDNVFKT